MNNVASKKQYQKIKNQLLNQLDDYLTNTGDPRALGREEKIIWDTQEYHKQERRIARPSERAIKKFNLKQEYDFRRKQ